MQKHGVFPKLYGIAGVLSYLIYCCFFTNHEHFCWGCYSRHNSGAGCNFGCWNRRHSFLHTVLLSAAQFGSGFWGWVLLSSAQFAKNAVVIYSTVCRGKRQDFCKIYCYPAHNLPGLVLFAAQFKSMCSIEQPLRPYIPYPTISTVPTVSTVPIVHTVLIVATVDTVGTVGVIRIDCI